MKRKKRKLKPNSIDYYGARELAENWTDGQLGPYVKKLSDAFLGVMKEKEELIRKLEQKRMKDNQKEPNCPRCGRNEIECEINYHGEVDYWCSRCDEIFQIKENHQ